MRELTPTALRNALDALGGDHDGPLAGLRDTVGGSGQWTGQFTFELRDAVTGDVQRREEYNTTVDVGENALLQFLGGITDSRTATFSGDGSTTEFNIPEPDHPIREVQSVTVGGTSQDPGTDYAVDYFDGTLYFGTAPSNGTDNIEIQFTYYPAPFEWLAVGTDGTSVTEGDTSLGAEDTRIALDSGYYTQDESAVEITGQWTFGQNDANVSIAEAALFNVSGNEGSGTMLNRTVVSPTIDKSYSQELIVTWTLSMS